MQFTGKKFVLAGQFSSGDKFVVASQMIEMAGGVVKDSLSITKDVNYLVLGNNGSPTWKNGICPQAIKAQEAIEKGYEVVVISEDTLLEGLAQVGVTLDTWLVAYHERLNAKRRSMEKELQSVEWEYDVQSRALTIANKTLPNFLALIEDAELVGLIGKDESSVQASLPLDGQEPRESSNDATLNLGSRIREYDSNDMAAILPWGAYIGTVEVIDCPNLIEVPPAAFAWHKKLKKASIPSARIVNNGGFYECKSLASVTMPEILFIGNGSFSQCSSLAGSLVCPNLQYVGALAFSYCVALTSLKTTRPDRVRSDGKTFKETGNSLRSIGEAAFLNCSSLKSVGYNKENCIMADNAFYGCKALESA